MQIVAGVFQKPDDQVDGGFASIFLVVCRTYKPNSKNSKDKHVDCCVYPSWYFGLAHINCFKVTEQ